MKNVRPVRRAGGGSGKGDRLIGKLRKLDTRQGVRAARPGNREVAATVIGDDIVGAVPGEDRRIRSGSAIQGVVGEAGHQRIVAVAAVERRPIAGSLDVRVSRDRDVELVRSVGGDRAADQACAAPALPRSDSDIIGAAGGEGVGEQGIGDAGSFVVIDRELVAGGIEDTQGRVKRGGADVERTGRTCRDGEGIVLLARARARPADHSMRRARGVDDARVVHSVEIVIDVHRRHPAGVGGSTRLDDVLGSHDQARAGNKAIIAPVSVQRVDAPIAFEHIGGVVPRQGVAGRRPTHILEVGEGVISLGTGRGA